MFVRIVYNSLYVCECVCVDYICILLYVVIYAIVSIWVCIMIHEPHNRFKVVSWIYV